MLSCRSRRLSCTTWDSCIRQLRSTFSDPSCTGVLSHCCQNLSLFSHSWHCSKSGSVDRDILCCRDRGWYWDRTWNGQNLERQLICLARFLKSAPKRIGYWTREQTQQKGTRIVDPTAIGASAHDLSILGANAKQVRDTPAPDSTAGADLDCTQH